jgi:5-(carboxyamino)imidazole ribonucleotide synthase
MHALPPGSTIGILGGGQLGRMLALAAARLGFKCHIYNDVDGPACQVAAATTLGAFDDLTKLKQFVAEVDVVTYEFENVPLAAAAAAESVKPVRPGPKALRYSQDRLDEKLFVSRLGIPVAPFAAIDSEADFAPALRTAGTPAILKTRRLGYDGKGQIRIGTASELASAFGEIGRAPAVLEGFVSFAFEVSVLIVRSLAGEVRFYDIPVNQHRDGILRVSSVPSALPDRHRERARSIAAAMASALDYVGVLAVEMFYVGGDAKEPLVVNEMAPRVHNSGHWTIDACAVSQFENHIRAIAGLPLGTTERHSDAEMHNLIGEEVNRWPQLAADPTACVHLYGKGDARPGRKMGHVTWIKPR